MSSLADVTHNQLGTWIAGASSHTPTEQNLEIILLAIVNGWSDYDYQAWGEMKKTMAFEPTQSDYEDLSWTLDDAVEWLNLQLPQGYYFTFVDTDFVLTHEDLQLVNDFE